MADSLDILRKDAIARRIKGVPGGNLILWSTKDLALIRDNGMALSEKALRNISGLERKQPGVDLAALRRKFAESGVAVKSDMQPDDRNILSVLSTSRVDLAFDSNKAVDTNNVDCSDFGRNPAVLENHNSSSALPIASSTMPWISGGKLYAIAKFPAPGASAESDRVAAAIRAGLVKGISIGFIPVKWKFSTDSTRPMGVDFLSIKLLEYSVCSLPCNPDCLIIGAVSGAKQLETVARIGEARALTAKVRSEAPPAATTREQRLQEARQFRRLAERT
jgi:HK97 family phage prohead protease